MGFFFLMLNVERSHSYWKNYFVIDMYVSTELRVKTL